MKSIGFLTVDALMGITLAIFAVVMVNRSLQIKATMINRWSNKLLVIKDVSQTLQEKLSSVDKKDNFSEISFEFGVVSFDQVKNQEDFKKNSLVDNSKTEEAERPVAIKAVFKPKNGDKKQEIVLIGFGISRTKG